MKKLIENNIILKTYLRLFPVQVLSLLSGAIMNLVSGTIVGSYLGTNALAAFGIINNISSMISMLSTLISSGMILLIGNSACGNDNKRISSLFSTSVILSIGIGLSITACLWLFADPIFTALGATSEILPLCSSYIRIISIAYPFALLNQLLLSMLMLSGDNRTPFVSSSVLAAVCCILNTLFVVVMKKGLNFVSLSNCLSMVTATLVAAIACRKKKSSFKFSFSLFALKDAGGIFVLGFSQSIALILGTGKTLFFTRMASDAGGATTLAAMSAVSNIDSFTAGLFPTACTVVSLMLVAAFKSCLDRDLMSRFIKTGFFFSLFVGCATALIVFAISGIYANILGENILYNRTAIRIFSAAVPFYCPYIFFHKIYASFGKTKITNLFAVLVCFVLPLGLCALLIAAFGDIGTFLTWPAGDFAAAVLTLVLMCILNKHFPRTWLEAGCIPDDFGVSKENSFSVCVKSLEDVTELSKKVIDFCRDKGLDGSKSYKCGLCLEEIASNIILHGFTKDKKKHTIDITLSYKDSDMYIAVRDDCVPFDPRNRFAPMDPENPYKGVGIRMIIAISKNTEYMSRYGLNLFTAVV